MGNGHLRCPSPPPPPDHHDGKFNPTKTDLERARMAAVFVFVVDVLTFLFSVPRSIDSQTRTHFFVLQTPNSSLTLSRKEINHHYFRTFLCRYIIGFFRGGRVIPCLSVRPTGARRKRDG